MGFFRRIRRWTDLAIDPVPRSTDLAAPLRAPLSRRTNPTDILSKAFSPSTTPRLLRRRLPACVLDETPLVRFVEARGSPAQAPHFYTGATESRSWKDRFLSASYEGRDTGLPEVLSTRGRTQIREQALPGLPRNLPPASPRALDSFRSTSSLLVAM